MTAIERRAYHDKEQRHHDTDPCGGGHCHRAGVRESDPSRPSEPIWPDRGWLVHCNQLLVCHHRHDLAQHPVHYAVCTADRCRGRRLCNPHLGQHHRLAGRHADAYLWRVEGDRGHRGHRQISYQPEGPVQQTPAVQLCVSAGLFRGGGAHRPEFSGYSVVHPV